MEIIDARIVELEARTAELKAERDALNPWATLGMARPCRARQGVALNHQENLWIPT